MKRQRFIRFAAIFIAAVFVCGSLTVLLDSCSTIDSIFSILLDDSPSTGESQPTSQSEPANSKEPQSTTQPETTQPASQPAATKPAAQPSATQPSSTQQPAPQRTPTQPSTTQQSTTQPVSTPAATQPAAATPAQSISSIRAAIVDAAKKYIGASYVYGAQSPVTMFDYSGFVGQAYLDAANIIIPRSAYEIWAQGQNVTKNSLQPGDIIVYNTSGSGASHVAIYVDNTYMIHAASAGTPTGVTMARLDQGSLPGMIIGYRTFVTDSMVSTATTASGSSAPAGTATTASGSPTTSRTTPTARTTPEISSRTPTGMRSARAVRTFDRSAVSAAARREFASNSLPLELTRTLRRNTEALPVMAGSGISFYVTNNTGSRAQFDVYFYEVGADRNSGATESFTLANGAKRETTVFVCDEAGQFRLEVINKTNNSTVLEQTYTVLE